MSHDDPPPRPVEWVDAEFVEPLQPGPPRRGIPRRAWVLIAAAIAALVILVVVRGHDGATPSAGTAASSPAPSSLASASLLPPAVSATPTIVASAPAPPVVVSTVGHSLLHVSAGWQLFGRGPGGVVRIDLAHGRIVTTTVPLLSSTGPVSFVPVAGGVVVRPLDEVAGYFVPDGQAPRTLGGVLAGGGSAFPGPSPNELWMQTGDGEQTAVALVGLDGRPVRAPGPVTIPVPASVGGPLSSDGTGYLVVSGIGGVYDARPGGLHRLTTGELLAVGPTRWLVVECDTSYRCSTVAIDRSSGARRILGPAISDPSGVAGVISPDGSVAAVLIGNGGPDGFELHLLNLQTGADQAVPGLLPTDEAFTGDALAWSPDSRWLFVADGTGQIRAVDGRTADVSELGAQLPQLTQLAVRAR